jgi:hypothetical protein
MNHSDARRGELDVLRCAAILGVLVIHNQYSWDETTSGIHNFLFTLSSWSVLIFFYLSGLLSRPESSQPLNRRLRRSLELLLVWLLWGCLYTLAGWVSLRTGLLMEIPNLFSTSFPFFVFSYQLYFLVVLALIMMMQALWLNVVGAWPRPIQVSLELFLACLLVVSISLHGWPVVPHGSGMELYVVYATAFLLGALQSRALVYAVTLSLFTALCCLITVRSSSASWFLVCFPLITVLLAKMVVVLPRRWLMGISLLSACSGTIYILHHPLFLPVSRRFWRLVGIPDVVNYFLGILLAASLPVLLIVWMRPLFRRWGWLHRLLLVQRYSFESGLK